MSVVELPLFPLHAVLFPGGPLAVRIFEPRYLDMIGRAIKDDSPIGVCLISEGDEIGAAATPYEIGTIGRVHYWHRRADGMLGVTLIGERRFRILSRRVEPDNLVVAQVESLAPEPWLPLPPEFAHLAESLREIVAQLDHPYIHLPKHYDDAGWVGSRLAELLPLQLVHKQLLLQIDEPLERLDRLRQMAELNALL